MIKKKSSSNITGNTQMDQFFIDTMKDLILQTQTTGKFYP